MAELVGVGHPRLLGIRAGLSPRDLSEIMAYHEYNSMADDAEDLRAGQVAMWAARGAGARVSLSQMTPNVKQKRARGRDWRAIKADLAAFAARPVAAAEGRAD